MNTTEATKKATKQKVKQAAARLTQQVQDKNFHQEEANLVEGQLIAALASYFRYHQINGSFCSEAVQHSMTLIDNLCEQRQAAQTQIIQFRQYYLGEEF
jgi:hypothetical protein